MKRDLLGIAFIVSALGVASIQDAQALRLKVKQSTGENSIIAASAEETDLLQKKKGMMRVDGRTAQLTALADNSPQSVVIAYKSGSRVLPAKKVLANPERYCADGELQAYTAVQGARVNLSLKTRDEGTSLITEESFGKKVKLTRKNLTGLVSVDENCLPSGNGLSAWTWK